MSGRPVVALDLDSVARLAEADQLDRFHWPTDQDEYRFISYDLVDLLIESLADLADRPLLATALQCKLYDIFIDLGRIAQLALDLCNVRSSGSQVAMNPADNPIFGYLRDAGTERPDFLRRSWPRPTPQGLRARIGAWRRRGERFARMALPRGPGRLDAMSQGPLLNEFCEAKASTPVQIYPYYLGWPPVGEPPAQGARSAAEILGRYLSLQPAKVRRDAGLLGAVERLAGYVLRHHLAQALSDRGYLDGLGLHRRLGSVLLSGTPKYIGRLLGAYYRDHGRGVVRFAHGGDRTFFEDYHWSISELPFCERYFCHSGAEAAMIGWRRVNGGLAQIGDHDVVFDSLGSRRHQRIHEAAMARGKRTGRKRTIIYVAGSYVGESFSHVPDFKLPDALYVEWQVWLINTLKRLGYRVVTKIHPKGLSGAGTAVTRISDDVMVGNFDPANVSATCLLFDFAGSAFIDSLATLAGLVLIDLGNRPFNTAARRDLCRRCVIVPGERDDRNRLRIAPERLGEAIERAAEFSVYPAGFAARYFGAGEHPGVADRASSSDAAKG